MDSIIFFLKTELKKQAGELLMEIAVILIPKQESRFTAGWNTVEDNIISLRKTEKLSADLPMLKADFILPMYMVRF